MVINSCRPTHCGGYYKAVLYSAIEIGAKSVLLRTDADHTSVTSVSVRSMVINGLGLNVFHFDMWTGGTGNRTIDLVSEQRALPPEPQPLVCAQI